MKEPPKPKRSRSPNKGLEDLEDEAEGKRNEIALIREKYSNPLGVIPMPVTIVSRRK